MKFWFPSIESIWRCLIHVWRHYCIIWCRYLIWDQDSVYIWAWKLAWHATTNRVCMNRPTLNDVNNIKKYILKRPCMPSEDWNRKRCCILSDCYALHGFFHHCRHEQFFSLHFTTLCLNFQTQKRILYEWPLSFCLLFWSSNNLKNMAKSKETSIHIFSFLLCRRKNLKHLKWHAGE